MTEVSTVGAAFVLLSLGWGLRASHGGWLAPGPACALFWAAALTLPRVATSNYDVSATAVWYLVLLVVCFALGSSIALHRPAARAVRTPSAFDVVLLRWLVVGGTICGFVATFVLEAANGFSVSSALSAHGLLDSAGAFSVDRYAGRIVTPLVVPPLMAFTYAAAVLAPFCAKGLRRPVFIACYAGPSVAATFYAALTTARAGMLTVASFLFAGWLCSMAYDRGRAPRMRLRSVLVAGACLVVTAGLFVWIAFLRVGSYDPSTQRAVGPKLLAYAFGYLPAFSYWFEHSAPTWPSTWGSATFAGLVSPGRGDTRAFADRAPLGGNLGSTNIFTSWRYLVEDSGIVLAPLVVFALGWVVGVAWRGVLARADRGCLVVVLCFWVYLLTSTTQTVFLFTNIVAAIAVSAWALSRRPRPLCRGAISGSAAVSVAERCRSGVGDRRRPSAHRPPLIGTPTVLIRSPNRPREHRTL